MLITSSSNPRIKSLRELIRQGRPDQRNRIPVEGIKLVEEAHKSNLRLEEVYVAQSKCSEDAILRLVKQARQHGPSVIHVSDRVLQAVAGAESAQGIIAVVKMPRNRANEVLKQASLIVVAHQLQDPGNLGTLIRSAEAFGIEGVLLTQDTVSPFNQKAVRASAGSIFRMPVFSGLGLDGLIYDLRRRGFRWVAAIPEGEADFRQIDYRPPTALLIGKEGSGLDQEVVKQMDFTVRITTDPAVESLNAATAASIILCEAARQRHS